MKRILISGLIALLIGCGAEPAHVYTPYGINVIKNSHDTDLSKIDRKYLATTECLGFDEATQERRKKSFSVEIKSQGNYFRCSESQTGKCIGLYLDSKNLIQIPAGRNAFSHELVHHFIGYNGNDSRTVGWCGDRIDEEFNDAE